MRTLLLVTLAALVGATAATAYAQSANDTNSTTSTTNDAALHEWQKERRQNLTEFRRDALQSFEENRTLLRARFDANVSAIRTTFLEAKADAIQACLQQAAPYGRDADGHPGPHQGVYADCMKGKLATLRETARSDHENATKAYRTAVEALRDASVKTFQDEKAAWEAAHPKP
jgi:hypothetical protein